MCKLSQLSPTTRTPSTAPGTIPQTCAGAFYLIVRRRFPPPWSVEELDACFIVSDSAGQKPAHVYFEEKPGRTRSSFWP